MNKNDFKLNGINKSIKIKGCRCGFVKKCKGSDVSNNFCWDGVCKCKCLCVVSGIGCLEFCWCVNCGNIF